LNDQVNKLKDERAELIQKIEKLEEQVIFKQEVKKLNKIIFKKLCNHEIKIQELEVKVAELMKDKQNLNRQILELNIKTTKNDEDLEGSISEYC
jgi:hypothetical protein